ncbi:MAG: NAD-dependent epimerase/dehydratase family protein [Bacteriovoracaceae bacterium]|nr:NAD-dependent epimerase/dehydratase family protein [Bacteriovoracaceae bacterium]
MAPKVLVIGASGFVGQNLIHELELHHISVRATSRHPEQIFSNAESTITAHLDLDSPSSIESNLEGIEVIYYLAHAMSSTESSFKEREKTHAHNLAKHLDSTHRLIYLGGISAEENLSQHLQSRKDVGEIFRKSKARTIEFQASIVIGRGSASFEMIRALVYRLPFIVTADWANAPCQPIAIKDVVSYLVAAREMKSRKKHLRFEIAGPDVLSYKELLIEFARHENLFRPEIKINKLPKPLAKEVMKIVIPEYYDVGSKLLNSIEIATIAQDQEALEKFDFTPMAFSEALTLARDESLEELNPLHILNKLKAHPELPKFLIGQTLQTTIFYKDLKQFETFAERVRSLLPKKFIKHFGSEIFLKVPMVGQIKLMNNKEQKYLLMAYKPKFFFQTTGLVLFEKIYKQFKN